MRRMIGGADTALLTLENSGSDSNSQNNAPGESFASTVNRKPATFIGVKPTYKAMTEIITTFNQKPRLNKKDIKLAASQLFDAYSYSTPQARSVFDSSVPLNGFVEELGQVVSLSPDNAKVFFKSLMDLIEDFNPGIATNSETPLINAQMGLSSGSGKGGCGCCKTCGGDKPIENSPPPSKSTSDNVLKAQQGDEAKNGAKSPMVNIMDFLNKRRQALESGSHPEPTKTEEKKMLQNKDSKPEILKDKPSILGSGYSNVDNLIAKAKKEAQKKYKGSASYSEVRSPTSTSTSTKADTRGNVTVTGGPGNTTLNIYGKKTGKGIFPGSILRALPVLTRRGVPEPSPPVAPRFPASRYNSAISTVMNTDWAAAARKRGSAMPNKRAEIVKQVMNKRGVSMIEASKIVKAEGLY